MKVLSVGRVEFLETSLNVDLDPGLSSNRVKPKGNVSSCSFYQWTGVRSLNVLLYEFGEIINLIEEYDPAVIGSIMLRHLSESVESLFGERRGEVLLDVVSVH